MRSRRPAYSDSWPASWKISYEYDRMCDWGERFDAPYATSYEQRRRRTLEALKNYCSPPARVLDLAAASGNFSIAAAKMGYRVTWNDLRGELADYVRLKMSRGTSVDFLAGNIFDLGNSYRGAFDAVMALEVIEHVAHPDDFLAKVAALVKPGGPIIISTPNGSYFRNDLPRFSDFDDPSVFETVQFKPNADGHIFLLYEDEMRKLGENAGLELVSYEQFTNPLSAGHVKLRYLHRVLPAGAIEMVERLTGMLPDKLKASVMCASLVIYRK